MTGAKIKSHGSPRGRVPNSRDFVPWRFQDAGRLSARRRCHCRRPKTCTNAEVSFPTQSPWVAASPSMSTTIPSVSSASAARARPGGEAYVIADHRKGHRSVQCQIELHDSSDCVKAQKLEPRRSQSGTTWGCGPASLNRCRRGIRASEADHIANRYHVPKRRPAGETPSQPIGEGQRCSFRAASFCR
jgi:hypothetical protein